MWTTLTTTFKVTDLIATMMSMISALLGKDSKYAESNYFAQIADFFKG